ncbi:alpha/beta hydrolase [Chryseobacterium sp. PBS4-4]|uniref:Alpha/beta hydrolase n=1 Tax=Chryseobacterium edaphi TaxID=2976532 RepID=A0ABT2W5R5_9FLAO|nr:alpha/beta hydrolase [Chryseobacterium edaphi]MCU7616607.1 alpha/beta hydrolase [Chryseobacterium edaphi]
MQKSVKFKNRDWEVAADLYLPEGFNEKQKYSAIVCVHPGSSVKEQTAGYYAKKISEEGFVTIAFDASFQGESGGEPRYLEDPATRVEDIKCAVDYLTTLDFIDENKIGVLGICAGGGYAANVALTEKRIKAVGTVSASNFSCAFAESGDPLKMLEEVGKQRTAEARGAEPLITNWTPNSREEAIQSGITASDMLEAIDYYRTPRGFHERSNNKILFKSMGSTIVFDAFNLADYLLTQPLLIIVGDRVGEFGSYRDGFTLFNKAASKDKNIYVVKGAGHYDLYDQPEATSEALGQLIPFFEKHL